LPPTKTVSVSPVLLRGSVGAVATPWQRLDREFPA
jgi:hypothetical protein